MRVGLKEVSLEDERRVSVDYQQLTETTTFILRRTSSYSSIYSHESYCRRVDYDVS